MQQHPIFTVQPLLAGRDFAPVHRRRSLLESPYARFNLRRNPFGELTREERAELAVVDVQRWLGDLHDPAVALQFIGDKGEGKTTHLLALERCLTGAGYVYLPEDGPQPRIPERRPLLIDEVQRLSRRQRRRVFRRGGPLILGTHEDFASELCQAGLRVSTIDVAAHQTPERLAQILNARIEASRISSAPVPRIEIPYVRRLQRQFGDVIRDMEQTLYHEFQAAVQKGLPWPPAA